MRIVAYLFSFCLATSTAVAEKPIGGNPKKGGAKDAATGFVLVALDDFENGTNGWPSPGKQTSCTAVDSQLGVFGLYGSGSVDSLSKTYTTSGEQSYIRVQATVAFLDDWKAEGVSLSVDGEIVWSEAWHQCPAISESLCRGINVCGDNLKADRLGRHIDIIVPHSDTLLTLTFETNLVSVEDGASLLIDDIRISAF